MTEKNLNAGTRLGTMILDHFIMTFGTMIFAIPGMISGFATAFNVSHERTNPDLFGNMSYVMLIGLAVYFCKDSINGRSPAKRFLKLQVVDNTTGIAASPIKCFLRNIFCALWPIEVIVALINPNRRIGDFVAGTKVVPFDQTTKQQKPNWGQIGISLALAYGLMLIIMIPFNMIKSDLAAQQVKFNEVSFNELDSKAIEKLFADSLGNYLTPDIRVYDKIENADLKYVSIIFRLKKNYLADEQSFGHLKSITVPLLLTKFSERTFVGRIQYVYQSSGSMQSRTLPIDWRETADNQQK
ncbi:MAG: RDD family protein [Bacteroidota bacterium]|jgi:uncharacterized RDD family membrane protein YckC|nr:RDD family protein [Cytophagales bacterium]MCE2958650.1 RDD family protein [Flammeovirgaceae bacterium]MCZ8071860.1 RDD family protein [Cytophagales bacterium]